MSAQSPGAVAKAQQSGDPMVQRSSGPEAHRQSAATVPHLHHLTITGAQLKCAEYCFYVIVDFDKSVKEDTGMTSLKQILTALLNTSGGILEIRSSNHQPPEPKTLDKWKRNLVDALAFIPDHVYTSCIRLLETYPYQICVKKSGVFITMETHMYVRDIAGNKAVRDIATVSRVMTRTTERHSPDPFAGLGSVVYNTKSQITEGENIELKCWNAVTTFDNDMHKNTYKLRLQDKRLERTLLALPNMPSGGHVVIGISEKSYVACGQIISEEDETRVRSVITEFVKRNSVSTKTNLKCEVKFIPVYGGPPGERRRLIVISLNDTGGNKLSNIDSLAYNSYVDVWNCKDVVLRYWPTVVSYADGTENSYKSHLHSRDLKQQLSRLLNGRCGGHMVIGIEEREENMTVGQVVSERDEEEIESLISRYLREDIDGHQRVWGDGSTFPETPAGWSIRFIPVTGTSPGERRRLIVIGLRHFPGGVWLRCPEAFTVNEDGFIQSVVFEEWLQAIRVFARANSVPTPVLSSVDCVVTNATNNNQSSCPDESSHGESESYQTQSSTSTLVDNSNGNNGKSMNSDPTPRGNRNPSTANPRHYYIETKKLSFTHHKKDWRQKLKDTSTDLDQNVTELAESSIFVFSNPVNLTPSKATIISVQRKLTRRISTFLGLVETSQDSFAIASSSWSTNVKCDVPRPKHHVFDLFQVDKSGRITLWVVVEKFDKKMNDDWTYTLLCGRMTKRRILQQLDITPHPLPNSWIDCRLYSLDQKSTKKQSQSTMSDWFTIQSSQMQQFKLSMAAMLLRNETRIRTIFGEELSVKLTAMQMEAILSTDLERYVFIEGPPGAGKTYLALYLCQRHQDYIYMCTTDTFKKFLVHKGLDARKILVAPNAKVFLSHIRKIPFQSVDCLVFDDFQNTCFSMQHWAALFEAVAKSKKTRLFIFGDSRYQHYEDTTGCTEIASHMISFCYRNNFHFTAKHLMDIHRNTRKITSFIQSNFDSLNYPDIERIKCSRAEDGDDVEIRYLPNIFSNERPNSLLDFVTQLTDPKRTINNEIASYEPGEVAILLDRSEEDVFTLMKIFTDHAVVVHDASTFPVTGYTIDMLQNFLGMDRKVCVVVTNESVVKSNKDTGHSLKNPRYKTFAASRGISRVVFVVESDLSPTLAANFGFDQAPGSDVTMLWQQETTDRVYDFCVIQGPIHPVILYITYSFPQIHFSDLDGTPVKIVFDDPRAGDLQCACSNISGSKVAVSSMEAPCRIVVYNVESKVHGRLLHDVTTLEKKATLKFYDKLSSMRFHSYGYLIILTDKVVKCISEETGRELWSYTKHLVQPRRLAVSENGATFVACQNGIVELKSRGENTGFLVTRHVRELCAICVDSTASFLLFSKWDSRDIYRMTTFAEQPQRIIRAPGDVKNLFLYKDRYLGVAALRKGLTMYDVRSLVLADPLEVSKQN